MHVSMLQIEHILVIMLSTVSNFLRGVDSFEAVQCLPDQYYQSGDSKLMDPL